MVLVSFGMLIIIAEKVQVQSYIYFIHLVLVSMVFNRSRYGNLWVWFEDCLELFLKRMPHRVSMRMFWSHFLEGCRAGFQWGCAGFICLDAGRAGFGGRTFVELCCSKLVSWTSFEYVLVWLLHGGLVRP